MEAERGPFGALALLLEGDATVDCCSWVAEFARGAGAEEDDQRAALFEGPDRPGRQDVAPSLTRQGPRLSTDELEAATAVADVFRKAHRIPMANARAGLRSCIESDGLQAMEVAQRLKRMPTVIDKLRRLPTMKLSSMQDIGGCRAVFETQAEIARVQERFMLNSALRNDAEDTVRDYVAPRDSGYRAVHLWTRYGSYRVEVQLRTSLQHRWAKLVEDITTLTGIDYKSGEGAGVVHDWLRRLSAAHALEEAGVRTDTRFERTYTEARAAAWAHIARDVEGRERGHG